MKVLWLVNMMPKEFALAIGRVGTNYQGWVAGLRNALRNFAPEVELVVACGGPHGARAFVNGVKYVSVGGESFAEVDRCIGEVCPDIIHLHGSEGSFPALPRNVWRGIPVCMSLQGIMNGYHQHYDGGLSDEELKGGLTFLRRLGFGHTVASLARLWRDDYSRRESTAFSNIPNVLGRTEWDCAWTKYMNPNATYYEVGEVLREQFYMGGRELSKVVQHTIYCGASMLYPLKGGHWLVRAVASLKKKYPDIRLRVANAASVKCPVSLIGKLKWGQYQKYLNRLITMLGLEANIDLLPELTADEVRDELLHAEVFCLPSLIENSPNSLGEAMMLGVPCVATDVGGVSSVMVADRQGVLVPSNDPAVLAAAIDRLFSDTGLARTLGDAGYRYAESRYAPGSVVRQLLRAYSQIIERSGNASGGRVE